MLGMLVDYARFVEVQQHRAHLVAQRLQPSRETSLETNGSAAVVDDHAFDIDESRQQFVSMRHEAAQHRGSTTRESLDVG
jgi:hypothetical protein